MIPALFLLFSCSNKGKESVPKHLLTEQEMVSVLADIQIIEADLTSRKTNQQDIAGWPQQYYDQLFEHHGITDSVFSESLRYYTLHPATLERIMDSVVQRLTKEQQSISLTQ